VTFRATLPVLLLAIVACAKGSVAPTSSNPDAAPSATPEGGFAGGACTTDADCVVFSDCCGAVSQCGNKERAQKQHELCACCVSCPAPDHPPPPTACGCRSGRCAPP
jgi:hypothetical protein